MQKQIGTGRKLALGSLLALLAVTAHAQWQTVRKMDPMTDREDVTTYVKSSAGSQYAAQLGFTLIRDTDDGLPGGFVRVPGEVLRCGQACELLLRVDAEPARSITAQRLPGGMFDALALTGSAQLMEDIARAKVIRLQVPLYRKGAAVLEFQVSGFVPPKRTGSAAAP